MFAKRSAIQNKFQLAVRTVSAQRYKIRAAIGPELADFLQESANEVCAFYQRIWLLRIAAYFACILVKSEM